MKEKKHPAKTRFLFNTFTSAVGGILLTAAGIRFYLKGESVPALLAFTAGLLMLLSAWGYRRTGKKTN